MKILFKEIGLWVLATILGLCSTAILLVSAASLVDVTIRWITH